MKNWTIGISIVISLRPSDNGRSKFSNCLRSIRSLGTCPASPGDGARNQ